MPPAGEITITLVTGSRRGGEMEQLVTAAPPGASFGALLRGHRRRALLSQEQLAARADLGARTVRALEAGRVRSPRLDTVRLLADALQLTGPQRENLLAAAPQIIHHRAGPAARGPAPAPSDVPAPPPLAACRFGIGGQPQRCCWLTAVLLAEITAPCQRADRPAGPVPPGADLAPTVALAGRTGPGAETGHDRELSGAERRELAQLRRENRRLREDVETLTRATAILATPPGNHRADHQGERGDSASDDPGHGLTVACCRVGPEMPEY